MKQKDVILFNDNAKKNNRNSKFAFRAFVRYAIIITIGTLITLSLFEIDLKNINQFKDKKEELISIFIKISVIIGIAMIALKLNQYYFNGAIFSLLMVIGMMVYSWFVWKYMNFNKVGDTKQYISIIYYLLPLIGFVFVWYFGIWFFERKTRPFVSKFAIWKMVNVFLQFALIGVIYLLLRHYSDVLDQSKKDFVFYFDVHDSVEFFIFSVIAMLIIALLVITAIRSYVFRKNKSTKTIRNTTIGMAIMIIAPLLIWYSYMSYTNPSTDNKDLLFLGLELIPVIGVTVFALLRRVKVASPTVKMFVYSLSIMSIWMVKFWFDFYWSGDVNIHWENIVALSVMLYILVLMFALDVSIQKSFALSIRTMSMLVLIYIVLFSAYEMKISDTQTLRQLVEVNIEKIRDVAGSVPPGLGFGLESLVQLMDLGITGLLNVLLLIVTVFPTIVSSVSWYRTQSVISKRLKKKIKSRKKAGKNV